MLARIYKTVWTTQNTPVVQNSPWKTILWELVPLFPCLGHDPLEQPTPSTGEKWKTEKDSAQ